MEIRSAFQEMANMIAELTSAFQKAGFTRGEAIKLAQEQLRLAQDAQNKTELK